MISILYYPKYTKNQIFVDNCFVKPRTLLGTPSTFNKNVMNVTLGSCGKYYIVYKVVLKRDGGMVVTLF